MNDLEMIRELDDTEWPDAAALNDARADLLAALHADPHRRRRRLHALWIGAATAGVAAATALILVTGTAGHHTGRPAVAAPAATIPAVSGVAIRPPAAVTVTSNPAGAQTTSAVLPTVTSAPDQIPPHLTAPSQQPALRIAPAAFLARAAAAAKAAPDIAPRPDQFLYVKDGDYEAWLSMDGTHDGLIDNGEKIVMPGCRNGVEQLGNTAPDPCTLQPAYLADAPSTPRGMAAYIASLAGSARPNSLGKELMSLAEFNYLRPSAKAALFGAAPLLQGLHLTGASVTNLGIPAVAITWHFGTSSTTLLFDPTTYALVGCTTSGENGEIAGSQIRQAVVDHVGQRL